MQNGHIGPLQSQMFNTSFYPTEYRVKVFSLPYMAAKFRSIVAAPAEITYDSILKIEPTFRSKAVRGNIQINLLASGFHTHGQGMSQRSIQMGWQVVDGTLDFEVNAPRDASVMPLG